jgi:predicted Zn-dependent protease
MDLRRGSELPSSIAEAELALGLLELELEQKQDSREARAELEHLGRRLLELAAGLSAPDDAVRVRLSLARWALRVADTSAAREQIEAALEVLGSSPLPLLAWRAQALLATTCEREGQRARAERARDEAAKLLGQVARGIADPELRRRFLSTKDACEVLADLDGAAAFPAS